MSLRQHRAYAMCATSGVLAMVLTMTASGPIVLAKAESLQIEAATPAVAILPFTPPPEYRAVPGWHSTADAAQQSLGDHLTNAGIPVVTRREIMSALTDEQVLNLSGSVTQAAEFGKRAGARYMLSGAVSSLTRRVVNISFARFTEAEANIVVRLIDVERGVFLTTYTRAGKSRAVGANLPADTWGDPNVSKAIRKAIEMVGQDLVPYYRSLPRGVAAAAAPGASPLPAPATDATFTASKRWSVMVVIPETHLARPRVPDPAAETEIVSRLITAGYRVFDEKRTAAIRNERWVQELYAGTATAAQLATLRARYAVDIVVTGEGISERAETRSQGALVVSRGRVEIKAILLETGEILSSRDEQQGGQDLSEIMASKLALRQAGAIVAPKLIADLDAQCARRCGGAAAPARADAGAGAPPTAIELEVAGWTSLSGAREFLASIGRLKGVIGARQNEYRGGILFATVEIDGKAMSDLALALEDDAALQRFRVAVQTAGKTKIEARVK